MPYSPPFCYLLRDLTYSLVHFSPRAIEKAYFAFILAVIFSTYMFRHQILTYSSRYRADDYPKPETRWSCLL